MNNVGDSGEELARTYLFKKGYRILEQNYKVSFGEIDIIAKKSNCICFVEVKSRKSNKHGTPEEAITRCKQKKIIKVAQLYIKQKRIKDTYFRFDVIVVVFDNYLLKEIKHIINAFYE